jgi:hypothetical protein
MLLFHFIDRKHKEVASEPLLSYFLVFSNQTVKPQKMLIMPFDLVLFAPKKFVLGLRLKRELLVESYSKQWLSAYSPRMAMPQQMYGRLPGR